LSKEEWRILGALVAVIVIFSGLLYYDLNKKQSFGNRMIIGTITFKKNIVQRKFDSQVTWARVEQNSPLANRDTVLSSDFSDAVIQLKDGTEIQVDENTMLFLEILGEDANIDFATGSIKVKKKESGGDLKIKSKEATIQVGTGDIKLEQSKDKDLNLFVNEGVATVNDGKTSQKLSKEQQAEFGKDGVNVQKIGLRPISPENQKFEYLTDRSLAFQWAKSDEFSSTVLELSKRRNFDPALKKIHTSGSSVSVPFDSEGTYYWRVTGINQKTNKKETSESRKITITKKETVKLISPHDGNVISFNSDLPKIDFNWKKMSSANGYKLELSKSKNFSEIFQSYDLTSNSFSVENLKEGKYFWRISIKSAVSGAVEEKTSPFSFSIVKKNELDSPVPIAPKDGKVFSTFSVQKNGISFSWSQPSSEIVKSVIQIAKDEKFFEKILTEKVSANSFKLQSVNSGGQFFWRVKGISSSGKETGFSKMMGFHISQSKEDETKSKTKIEDPQSQKHSRSVTEKDETEKEKKHTFGLKANYPVDTEVDLFKEKALKLSWNRQSGAESYTVKIYNANKKSTKPIFEQELNSTHLTITDLSIVEEGEFFWTISPKMKSGEFS
ncbi:MAG: FecR domain-containing protein, partial [Leptospiraceae bacterium]|nr:FecR domain-containing protein [Leptospiraceae bacterium]